MQKILTDTEKILKKDLLIQRDGLNCLYCPDKIDPNNCDIDHMNNQPLQNELWNLHLTHHKCNCDKRKNTDLQILANEKIRLNQSQIFVPKLEDNTPQEASTEIQININSSKIAERYITEEIQINGFALFDDSINCITFLCKKNTGHGSNQSSRNYIKTLTCSIAPFMITKNDEGKKVIVRREN